MTSCDPNTRDRLSIHLENGEHNTEREAVTILRNGGTASQSGLVGITNATYNPAEENGCANVVIPETIFNVQSTGDSNIRFSSGPSTFYRSSLELLGNGNHRSSGLHISYDPQFDDAVIAYDQGYGYYEPCPDPNAVDNTVADFSLIRASGCEGMEFSHISMSERGYVSVGLTRAHKTRHFKAVAPLTVGYFCDGHNDSGTIAMREQSDNPVLTEAGWGKLFVKPYEINGLCQALYFQDDCGNVTNLIQSQDISVTNSFDGLIFGDNGNTYGGWYTPALRQADPEKSNNTYYGWGAGFHLSEDGSVDCNTLIGYRAGSGLKPSDSNKNTVLGCNSLTGWSSADDTIVIGSQNLTDGDDGPGPIDSIIIGSELYQGDIPDRYTLAIGRGNKPLILGTLAGAGRDFTIQEASFEIFESEEYSYKISHDYSTIRDRHTVQNDIIDYKRVDESLPKDNFEMRFLNADGAGLTLWELDPDGAVMTQGYTWAEPDENRPFAALQGDFKLRGAIRFQDGTSLSGLSEFELLPTLGRKGIDKVLVPAENTNYFQLDYSDVELAGNVSSDIRSDNTFVAVQLDGTNSSNIGKMSLAGLADYITEGQSSIGENCNVLISNPENEVRVNLAANGSSVMIGCNVAFGTTGQTNSVIIGTQAGALSSVPNPDLTIDWSNIFIGSSAGYEADQTAYTIAIGNGAGKNADSCYDAIYLGNSAGLNASYQNSVGIGKHALEGSSDSAEGGNGNLEIIAGILNTQRLFHPTALENPDISDRMNIQNCIAGRSDRKNVSIGDARLSPTSPLEARRDSATHADNPNNYIQAWYCDDQLVASLDCDGNFVSNGGGGFIEGIIQADDNGLLGVASITTPTSGKLRIYKDGVNTEVDVYIKNRDANLTIPTTTYVVAGAVGQEYRPLWVSCPS